MNYIIKLLFISLQYIMNIFQQAWNSFDRSSEIKTTPFVPKTPEPKR